MKHIKLISSLCLCAILAAASCRKDDPVKDDSVDNVYKPTPFEIPREAWYPQYRLPAGNPLTEEGVLLGRMLFHDPIMSRDSTLSCARCHDQQISFSDSRRFSKGLIDPNTGQQPVGTRNSMALFNLMFQNRFFWDGRQTTLRGQVREPIQAHNEMDNDFDALSRKLEQTPRYANAFYKAFGSTDVNTERITKALEQFLVTLVSFDAPFDKLHNNHDTDAVIGASAKRGFKLFMTPFTPGGGPPGADCFHCHSNGALFGQTSAPGNMVNNGLDLTFTDRGFGNVTGLETDNGKFKVPSLRNVALTAPYMHDGRFATLEEVVDFYSDHVEFDSPNLDPNMIHGSKVHLNLTPQQKQDLVAFLNSLTDTKFINNPAYTSPF